LTLVSIPEHFEDEDENEEEDEEEEEEGTIERKDLDTMLTKGRKSQVSELSEENSESEIVEGEEDAGQDFGGGYKLEPFNLKEERRNREIDKEGNLNIERRGNKRKKESDAWLQYYDEISKKGEEKASIPQSGKISAKLFEENFENDQVDVRALKETICRLLEPKETVASALRRLGKHLTTRKKAKSSLDHNTVSERSDGTSSENDSRNSEFNLLTESAHTLLSNGFYNILPSIL